MYTNPYFIIQIGNTILFFILVQVQKSKMISVADPGEGATGAFPPPPPLNLIDLLWGYPILYQNSSK